MKTDTKEAILREMFVGVCNMDLCGVVFFFFPPLKMWFGFCSIVGMSKESEAFAGELFDALARRRDIHGDSINKAQLKDFWDQISDQRFDSRLRTFFDM